MPTLQINQMQKGRLNSGQKIKQFHSLILQIHKQIQTLNKKTRSVQIAPKNKEQLQALKSHRQLIMQIGVHINQAQIIAADFQSQYNINNILSAQRLTINRLNSNLKSLIKQYQEFIVKNQRLFEFVEERDQSSSIFEQADLQNHQQLKQDHQPEEEQSKNVHFHFKSDLRPQLSKSLQLLQYRDQQIELQLRQVDDQQEKKVLLQQVKQIKSLMKQIKQINNDLVVNVENQKQVLKQVELYAQTSLQHSKQGGEQLKQAAKYKNSSLKWYLGGTLTVAGAILGTLIPIPGVGNAIGAGVGLAIGGAIGGGIQKSQNKKLRKLKFKDKDDIEGDEEVQKQEQEMKKIHKKGFQKLE